MIGTDDEGGVRIKGTLQQRQLARALRRLREEAGLTLEEAAPKAGLVDQQARPHRNRPAGVDVHGVRSMLDLYNVGGARKWTEIIDMVRDAKQKGWWHAYGPSNAGYLALETDAAVVYDYQLGYVPGLLQTADYARAVSAALRRPVLTLRSTASCRSDSSASVGSPRTHHWSWWPLWTRRSCAAPSAGWK